MANRRLPPWMPFVILGGGILIIVINLNPFRFVANGQNLVVFSWLGGVQAAALKPGVHLIWPLISNTYEFDIKTQALTWKDNDDQAYGPQLVSLSLVVQKSFAAVQRLQYKGSVRDRCRV